MQHRLQRFVGWRRYFDELRRAVGAAPVHAVQHQAMQMNVEVGRRPKTLDQRDGSAVGFVRTRDGHAYTYDGLSAMLKRAIAKVNGARKVQGQDAWPSFGFRDLKGKGATDMWRDGVPIELIQHLCGHEDKSTTEIYCKQRWKETAVANMVVMG